MKKQYSIGWLIGFLLAVTAGTIVLLLVPVRSCPLCLSIGPRRHHIAMGLPPKTLLNCPTCGDNGKVPIVRAWRSRTLAPRVATLLAWQKNRGDGLDLALESIVAAGGKDPKDVLATRHFAMLSPVGEVRFAPGEEKVRLLVLLRCGPHEVNGLSLVLLDPDGEVLDVLSATCIRPTGRMEGRLQDWRDPDGTVASFSLRGEIPDSPSLMTWYDDGGKILPDRIPAPYRENPSSSEYRIGVVNDRLKIIPSAVLPAGP